MSNALRQDPSRTATLRRRFMSDMKRRFAALKKAINELLVDDDALGLVESGPFTFNKQVAPQAWRFRTDAQKLDSFHSWFDGQVKSGVLTTDAAGKPWTATYVESGYKQGVTRSYMDANKEALADNLDFYNGTKAGFLQSAFSAPESVQKVQLLSTRVFEELRGVTAAMSQQMSRELALGMANGLSPKAIAKRMSDNIDGMTKKRALTIARTEVVMAHAEGQLDSFERMGIEEVGLMAEWSTAGDDRVCDLCSPLEGTVMTVKEARGLIPRHPNCRCAWIPANVGEDDAGRAITGEEKRENVGASLQAEFPNEKAATAKKRSKWLGSTKTFRNPPKSVLRAAKSERVSELLQSPLAPLQAPAPGSIGSLQTEIKMYKQQIASLRKQGLTGAVAEIEQDLAAARARLAALRAKKVGLTKVTKIRPTPVPKPTRTTIRPATGAVGAVKKEIAEIKKQLAAAKKAKNAAEVKRWETELAGKRADLAAIRAGKVPASRSVSVIDAKKEVEDIKKQLAKEEARFKEEVARKEAELAAIRAKRIPRPDGVKTGREVREELLAFAEETDTVTEKAYEVQQRALRDAANDAAAKEAKRLGISRFELPRDNKVIAPLWEKYDASLRKQDTMLVWKGKLISREASREFVKLPKADRTAMTTGLDANVKASMTKAELKKLEKRLNESTDFIGSVVHKNIADAKFKNITVKHQHYALGNREGYITELKTMYVTKTSQVGTLVHELGHHIEGHVKDGQKKAQEFLARRTKNEKLVPLNSLKKNSAYDSSEMCRPDKFFSPYIGKEYKNNATEVISMGVQELYDDPVNFATKDPDMFDFIVDFLRGGA